MEQSNHAKDRLIRPNHSQACRGLLGNTTISASARSGFTLIEVLVYIGLFTLVVSFAVLALFQILDSAEANRNRLAVEAEVDFAMRKIAWSLRGAQAIQAPSGGASSTRLKVGKYGFAENPILFELSGSQLMFSKASSTPQPLLAEAIHVQNFTVTHIAEQVDRPEGVEVVLAVFASSTDERAEFASTTIADTFYLRK